MITGVLGDKSCQWYVEMFLENGKMINDDVNGGKIADNGQQGIDNIPMAVEMVGHDNMVSQKNKFCKKILIIILQGRE